MRSRVVLLITLGLVIVAGCKKEEPKGVTVNVPGVNIQANPGGVSVNVPGVDVKANPGGVGVNVTPTK